MRISKGNQSSHAGERKIAGQILDKAGKPLPGVFVRARNRVTGCSIYVLSQAQGRYEINDLEPGEYELMVAGRGWTGPAQTVTNDQSLAPVNLRVKRAAIYPSELTSAEILPLLPKGEGKEVLVSNCTSCHTLQKMVSGEWNTSAWREITANMRMAFGAQVPDGKEELLIEYVASAFAPQSSLHHAAEKLPATRGRPIDVRYTAWDIPLQKSLPHTATYDNDGNIWFTDAYGSRMGRLEVKSGKFKIWDAPTPNSIPHGIVVDKKGKVWFTERLHLDPANKIVRFDPVTEAFKEYPLPQKKSGPHTLIFDSQGILWISEYEGNRIARFDPETEKFTEYDVPVKDAHPYGVDIDNDGVIWIANIGTGSLGKLDPKVGKVMDYPTPTKNSGVRRVRADSKGRVWFTEFLVDRLGMFDPKTEKMTEYLMPGIRPQPYALEVTKDDKIWLSTWHQDVMVKFDPETKTFTSYPVPFLDLEIRDFRIAKDDTLLFVAMMPNKVVGMKAR
ncbi:MAG TPA: carboxypeptidase regulatory-like domain-containing protein [Pyrinomonadaceae bacterium]|nr:carboxypeptidase regulatory-like domain-containing protein [Pyrinomonadaceae bacterium]